MPKWECVECGHEFWGWGVYYRHKKGNNLVCPDCQGELILRNDNTRRAAAGGHLNSTSTAVYIWKTTGLH